MLAHSANQPSVRHFVAVVHRPSTKTRTSNTGSWFTRTLEDALYHGSTAAETGVSLLNNQITLKPGKYIIEGTGMGHKTKKTGVRIYDVSASVVVEESKTVYVHETEAVDTQPAVHTSLTVEGTEKIIELQQAIQYDAGNDANIGQSKGDAYGGSDTIQAAVYIWVLK